VYNLGAGLRSRSSTKEDICQKQLALRAFLLGTGSTAENKMEDTAEDKSDDAATEEVTEEAT
jgi:hypothetical protein